MGKTKPKTGQSAVIEPLNLVDLRPNERLIVQALAGDQTLTIEALAMQCFTQQSPKQANSWVRNALRRLVPGGWATKIRPGLYALSDFGCQELAESTTSQSSLGL